jgi:hypothetical protein
MPTLGDLKKHVNDLIKARGKDSTCAFAIWTAEDAETLADSSGNTITQKQAEEAIEAMHHHHDAGHGMTWSVLECELPSDLPIKPEENKEDWEP